MNVDDEINLPMRIGSYRLVELLGRGGMGAVYKAKHLKLQKVVAVKMLPRQRMPDRHALERFEREMKAIGKLEHPNIVQATDAGEADGHHFLVMEYVAGLDLARLVQRGGPLSVADACEAVSQAAAGLQHAHEHGLVHRDVKPANLMLSQTGQVKVLDLGLAKFLGHSRQGPELTASGMVLGTVDYLAPEQAGDSNSVDIRADVYSLGCTLFKLLTGQAPFAGPEFNTPHEKLLARLSRPVPSLRDRRENLPEELAGIVARMLATRPDDRFDDPAQVVEALRPFTIGADLARLAREQLALSEPARRDAALTETISHVGTSREDDVDHGARVRQAPTRPGRYRLLWTAAAVLGIVALAASIVFHIQSDRVLIAPLRVVAINVRHTERVNETRGKPRGILGQESFSARLGDQVTIDARLSRPAYAYLLAFRADGVVELCFPDEDTPPPLTDRLRYPPSSAEETYGLSEGTGLWVFAIVASEKPLSAYRDFVSRNKPAWLPQTSDNKPDDAATVWWYDGQRLEPLAGPGVLSGTRGKGERPMETSGRAVEDVAKSLEVVTGGTAAAIGFHVGPAR